MQRHSIGRTFHLWKQADPELFEPHLSLESFPKSRSPPQVAFRVSNVDALADIISQKRRLKGSPWKTRAELAEAFRIAALRFLSVEKEEVSDKENDPPPHHGVGVKLRPAEAPSSSKRTKVTAPIKDEAKEHEEQQQESKVTTKKPLRYRTLHFPIYSPFKPLTSSKDSDLYHRLHTRLSPNQQPPPSSSAMNNLIDIRSPSPTLRRSPRKRASLGRSPLRSSALAALNMYNSDDDDLTDTE